jgi:hypothetical protein
MEREAEWHAAIVDLKPYVPYALFQHYWRCAHHPSAIENFFDHRTTCEWGCHEQTLLWHHSGFHPAPKSWGTDRAARATL